MVRYKIPLLLQGLALLIPLNIYMWGDWLLVNLQWAFFRFQTSANGSCLIPLNRDIDYILLGYTTGIHNILAALFWTAGGLLLLSGFLVTVYACSLEEVRHIRLASFFTLGAGILFGISALERFTAGFAIPLGLPIIFITAWIMYQQQLEPDEGDDSSDNDEECPARELSQDPE